MRMLTSLGLVLVVLVVVQAQWIEYPATGMFTYAFGLRTPR